MVYYANSNFCIARYQSFIPRHYLRSRNDRNADTHAKHDDTRRVRKNCRTNASLTSIDADYPVWLSLIQGLIAGITINAVAAFGEELGWRGFLLHEFRNMKFLKASLIIGFIWGIWHAPMILMGHNYPQHPEAGILMMTIFCMLLSPLLMYITIKAKSVIAAAIAHGTMNAIAGISVMMIKGGNDLNAGITGLAGFIAIIVFVALILFTICI